MGVHQRLLTRVRRIDGRAGCPVRGCASGIELEDYAPVTVKDDVVFVTGKLDPRKGIFDILAIARELPQVRFRVMGWGPQEAEIRSAAPANMEFVPFERGTPLHRAFGLARIFLFPTKGETFGIALVEAMASGCAIVSSCPLPFEGVRIDAGDRRAMREAVLRLWTDRAACEESGRRNYEIAQQYSWQRYTDKLVACFQELLRPQGRPVGEHTFTADANRD